MKKGLILLLAGMCAWSAQATDFLNLDFEEYTPDSGFFSATVPGWGTLLLDPYPLTGASFGLVTTSNEYNTPLEGDASLFVGTGDLTFEVDEIWVSQTATVPTNATQIRFLTSLLGVGASLGGLPLCTNSPVTEWSGVYSYTADISSLTGQEAELKIAIGESSWGRYQLDRIEFLDAAGEVVWPLPPPYGPSAICLEDFHAATLNTSLWEVVSVGGEIPYSTNPELFLRITSAMTAREMFFRFRPYIYGDWDIVLDFRTVQMFGSGTEIAGIGLGAEFSSTGSVNACVGRIVNADTLDPRYMMDWGAGPVDVVSNAPASGMFRLVREGENVTGLIWSSESNQWQTVGTAGGFTEESSRIGIKIWNTGLLSGKGSFDAYSDNLMLVDGQVCLDGMAVKVFGLASNGVPSVSWDSVGIAETNRYFVTKATNLMDPDWVPVSSAFDDSSETNEWTGPVSTDASAYYRIEVAPE